MVEIWLDGQPQGVVVNGVKFCWKPVTCGVPQSSVLELLLCSIFIDDLDVAIECVHSKFEDDIKLGGSVDMVNGRKGLQRDLDRPDQWSKDNGIKVNKARLWFLCLGHRITEFKLEESSGYHLV